MYRFGLTLATLATFLIVPSAVHAQGSGSAGAAPAMPNFQTSRTFEGSIAGIDAREGIMILAIKDKKFRVDLHEDTELKADKKTGLHKNELSWDDFTVGSRVKLTVRTSDGKLLEARLRELAKEG
jgi:hypothetical protein